MANYKFMYEKGRGLKSKNKSKHKLAQKTLMVNLICSA